MSLLTGSPLGLTGLTSNPTSNGMSTFSGGNSLNINVDSYNRGMKQISNISGSTGNLEERVSLFTGGSFNKFWPNIGKIGTNQDTTGLDNSYNGIDREELHNDSVYDTSLVNIIEKLSPCPRAALRPQDFAYLKNIGVYPNNRLMIARRFTTPMKDNIMDKLGVPPRAILISWKPETENFLDFSFGEEWVTVNKADYTNVLNGIGKDFLGETMGKKLGGYLSEGASIIPLPGYTEQAQRKFFENIGLLEKGSSGDILPSGNPNIIKEARQRKIIGYGDADSGLKCTIKIKMDVEYEQKFISGVDPTVAWMDILSNALSFGTSNSFTYGLSKEFSATLDQWTTDPNLLIKSFVDALKESFESLKEGIITFVQDPLGSLEKIGDKVAEAAKSAASQVTRENAEIAYNTTLNSILAIVKKYKVEIMGITNALSGTPSTPWHITIGNPLRPIFCSGDMLTTDVTVTLGSTLAFNDLPSTIKVSFTLENARPLGMQEILAKFNTGYLRVTTVRKDFVELEDNLNLDKSNEDIQKAKEESDNYWNKLNAEMAANALAGEATQNITYENYVLLKPTTKESDTQLSTSNFPYGRSTKLIPSFGGGG